MARSWKVIDVNQKKYRTEQKHAEQDRTMWNPCCRVDLGGEETVDVGLYDTANQKVRKPTCHFGGKI